MSYSFCPAEILECPASIAFLLAAMLFGDIGVIINADFIKVSLSICIMVQSIAIGVVL